MLKNKTRWSGVKDLRNLSLSFIGFSITIILMIWLIQRDVKTMRIEVYLKNVPDKTVQTMNIGADKLIYGERGTLIYHPKSTFEKMIYSEFNESKLLGNLGCLAILITGLYTYWISKTTTENSFFSKSTLNKFKGLCFIWLIFPLLNMGCMELIRNHFYKATNETLILPFETILTSSMLLYVNGFIMSTMVVFFNRAIKIKTEQEMTI